MDELPRFSDAELAALFRRLFPAGFAGADVLAELAPGGWEQSPLMRAFHPTLDQWHDERVAQHRHFEELDRLWRRKPAQSGEAKPPRPEPTLEDSRREFADKPIDAREECTHIVGAITWEIFAETHLVIAADGREVDLGSWRAASSFLSEFADGRDAAQSGDRGDAMRFYMGLLWIRGRCDYAAVYRLVFRRVQREGLDWSYTFPRLYAFRFERDEEPIAAHDYSPSDAFAREQQRAEDQAEHARLQGEFDATEQTAREAARDAPPPPVVQAYHAVLGRWPEGWPP